MSTPRRVAYFAIRYPTLSQTFIRREIETLCRLGLDARVYPIWDFRLVEPGQSNPTIHRLTLWDCLRLPFRVTWEIWRERRRLPASWRLLREHWPTFWEGWFMTLWGTAFALYRRSEFAQDPPDRFHGAWATGPATAAAVLGVLLERPFSFGAHAYDIRRHGGDPLLDPKLRAAAFVHTTTEENIGYLTSRVPEAKVVLSRRGLPELPSDPGERQIHEPIRLLSVGRLVPKKAHSHQLAACAELRHRGKAFELRIAGEGPLLTDLQQRAAALGIADSVVFLGACAPAAIQELYAWADLFWHTGVVDEEGDRDGLPNVLPEAMSHRLPVISCPAAGATEAVRHERTGLVVETSDSVALAEAVLRIVSEEELRHVLGQNARRWVAENFLSEPNARILLREFGG